MSTKKTLLPAVPPEHHNFVHAELEGKTLFAQKAGEKERMHTSRDGNIKVSVSEYSERHIGNKPAERIHIVDERADLDFVIWSNKAGKFSSEVDRIKYAHLNFQMNGPFPRNVKGFF